MSNGTNVPGGLQLEAEITARANQLTRTREWPNPTLYALLQIRGLSVAWLMKQLGMSFYASIHDIATGRKVPGSDLRHKISALLGVEEVILWPFLINSNQEQPRE